MVQWLKARCQMTNSKKKWTDMLGLKNVKVVVPRVNPAIWSVLDHSTRGADLKIPNYQEALCTATYALKKFGKQFSQVTAPKFGYC